MSNRAFQTIIVCALSLSIGWGIRGNFGHEFGAMIPGALAALAGVILSGREDWLRRAPYFAMLGALGWSFCGSISYMWVIAYTHSGQFESQIYGYACLFVIGFTWAALGGAGTALPACIDRQRLTSLFTPMFAVFTAWWLQDRIVPAIENLESMAFRHRGVFYWYDSDWIAALLALAAVLTLSAVRRRIDWGSSLILHLAIGWWAVFLLVPICNDVLNIEFRMTPPRGDNWAGILGMVGGLFVFCFRHNLRPVGYAALVAGFWGGFGFAFANFLKLAEVKFVPLVLSQFVGPGEWQTNWHSVLEQTYGLINGIGIGVVLVKLSPRLPSISDDRTVARWTEGMAVAFVLLLIPYVNIVKNVPNLIKLDAIRATLYGWPTLTWFNLGYGIVALAGLVLIKRHFTKRLRFVPEAALGQGQLLYLAFLWFIVLGNLAHAIPKFEEQRLITEGVIHVNAVLCTLAISLWPTPADPEREITAASRLPIARNIGLGLVVLAATTVACTVGTRAIWGDTWVQQAGYHLRFGPDAAHGKPPKDKKHP
jgi:hypothetical protein